MVKKKGSLAGFGQVATPSKFNNDTSMDNQIDKKDKLSSDKTNETVNANNNDNSNYVTSNINNNNNSNIINENKVNESTSIVTENKNKVNKKDSIKTENKLKGGNNMSILEAIIQKTKEPKKKQIAIYIDQDIAVELDRLAKEQGKGFKSELINKLLKKELFGIVD